MNDYKKMKEKSKAYSSREVNKAISNGLGDLINNIFENGYLTGWKERGEKEREEREKREKSEK